MIIDAQRGSPAGTANDKCGYEPPAAGHLQVYPLTESPGFGDLFRLKLCLRLATIGSVTAWNATVADP